jgi:hypothetical protein
MLTEVNAAEASAHAALLRHTILWIAVLNKTGECPRNRTGDGIAKQQIDAVLSPICCRRPPGQSSHRKGSAYPSQDGAYLYQSVIKVCEICRWKACASVSDNIRPAKGSPANVILLAKSRDTGFCRVSRWNQSEESCAYQHLSDFASSITFGASSVVSTWPTTYLH